jgi:hypothetical protein
MPISGDGSQAPAGARSSFGSSLPRFNVNNLTAPMTWGFMLTYLTGMLLVPIVGMLINASTTPWETFIARATEPVAMSAYEVTFSMAFVACAFNAVFGFLLAWVLVKYKFPGAQPAAASAPRPPASRTRRMARALLAGTSCMGDPRRALACLWRRPCAPAALTAAPSAARRQEVGRRRG